MASKISFTFFGTDEFAIGVLNTLKQNNLTPDLIITTPDKPQGRKLILTPPPVKVWAEENSVPLLQPEKLKDFVLPPTDIAVVASYGKILPASLLTQPKFGFINVHPSLLPHYRGVAPLQTAILNGDTETGVTIMQVDAEMDHGAILAQKVLSLNQAEWLEELRDTLAQLGGEMVAEVMPKIIAGQITAQAQNHAQATYTKKITKEAGEINLSADPELNYRQIRAYTPWPGAYFFTEINGQKKRVIIKKARLIGDELVIDRVIPEGKKEVDYKNFTSTP